MIRIKSIKAGFRRCGIAHPDEWVEYEDDRFSEAELERLKDEPMLKVEVVVNKVDADSVEKLTADASAKQSKNAPADDQSQSAASAETSTKEPEKAPEQSGNASDSTSKKTAKE